MERWDLIVVGGGPAGSAAALAALRTDPSARVLVLDAAAFPRDKVCGDGIAPHAFDVLAGLGVDVDALTAGTAPIERLRLRSPGGQQALRPFTRPAHVVPREQFDDRLLAQAIAAGAAFRRHRVRAVATTAAGAVVDGALHARALIAADGAESVVRRQIGARAAPLGTVAIAVRGYAPAAAFPVAEQSLVMTRAHWPAYAWVFPVGNGLANVGYGELLQGTPPTRAQLVSRLHDLVPGGTPDRLRGHRLPLSTGRPASGRDRVLLTGDAASLINPLTGEGIYYAVLSGALAGSAAMTADPLHAYRRSLRRALGLHLRNTDAIAWLGRWPALLDRGVAAARSSQRSFDRLVEIGLGSGTVDARTVLALARGR